MGTPKQEDGRQVGGEQWIERERIVMQRKRKQVGININGTSVRSLWNDIYTQNAKRTDTSDSVDLLASTQYGGNQRRKLYTALGSMEPRK